MGGWVLQGPQIPSFVQCVNLWFFDGPVVLSSLFDFFLDCTQRPFASDLATMNYSKKVVIGMVSITLVGVGASSGYPLYLHYQQVSLLTAAFPTHFSPTEPTTGP